MTPAVVTLVIAAFLSGAVTVVFIMLAVGIRADDRTRCLTAAPRRHLEALARAMLGVGVRTGHFSGNRDGGKD